MKYQLFSEKGISPQNEEYFFECKFYEDRRTAYRDSRKGNEWEWAHNGTALSKTDFELRIKRIKELENITILEGEE